MITDETFERIVAVLCMFIVLYALVLDPLYLKYHSWRQRITRKKWELKQATADQQRAEASTHLTFWGRTGPVLVRRRVPR